MNDVKTVRPDSSRRGSSWPDYRAVWRWHFYAGLFCIPFVILLSITGALYLFKPQVEAWIDSPFEHLFIDGKRASAQRQVEAAVAAVPGSHLLAYELPASNYSAVRVLVMSGGDALRVYVHPQSLNILKTVREDDRFMRIVRTIHGELLIGNLGSALVELAACWAIVMVITGVYLWWPRQVRGLAGVLWPRLRASRRTFWRDLHAVTGIWISVFALFLLLTGLPWANVWGAYFKEVRKVTGTAVAQQDWSTGRAAAAGVSPEHLHHDHAAMMRAMSAPLDGLDRVAATAQSLQLAPPVLISPPVGDATAWTIKSDAQNRPLRATLSVDGNTGAILQREDFAQRHLVDRAVGIGVAAHEGQLFGWFNQLLGLLTALGLILLSISAVVLWWRRRAVGLLGAPTPAQAPRFSFGLIVIVAVLAICLPLFGGSVLLVLILEKTLLRRITPVSIWLGLGAIR